MAGFAIPAVIKFLQVVGPVTARLPEFKEVYDQIVATFKKDADQETLKKAYDELLAENTGGHARLQEMLRKASGPDASVVATDLTGTKKAPSTPDKS